MPAAARDDCILLPQNLTVRAITAAHEELVAFMKTRKTTTLALPDDCQLDLSFLQLVEAARIYAGTAGKAIALASPARGTLLDVLRRGGFLDAMSAQDAEFWLHQEVVQ